MQVCSRRDCDSIYVFSTRFWVLMSILDEIVRFVKYLGSLMCESHSILAAVGLTSAPRSDRMRAKLAIRSHI